MNKDEKDERMREFLAKVAVVLFILFCMALGYVIGANL